jgi:hypothetical protein
MLWVDFCDPIQRPLAHVDQLPQQPPDVRVTP